MPTYDYECTKCGERFEMYQTFAEEPLKKHPGTCKGKVVKVLSPAGIVFSGSGFYKTDNRSSGRKSAKNGSSDSAGTSESSSSDSSSSSSKESASKDGSSSKPAVGSSSTGSSNSSGNS